MTFLASLLVWSAPVMPRANLCFAPAACAGRPARPAQGAAPMLRGAPA